MKEAPKEYEQIKKLVEDKTDLNTININDIKKIKHQSYKKC